MRYPNKKARSKPTDSYKVDTSLLLAAKRNYNDMFGIDEIWMPAPTQDKMFELVGITVKQWTRFMRTNDAYLWVDRTAYRKLLVLGSGKARYHVALFKIIDMEAKCANTRG